MSIQDFVCYVLKVPVNLIGYGYICSSIEYVVENNGDPDFYGYVSDLYEKNYAAIEKCIRLAKDKSVDRMCDSDYAAIFLKTKKEGVSTKEFICYAAHYYRKEYMSI